VLAFTLSSAGMAEFKTGSMGLDILPCSHSGGDLGNAEGKVGKM
jgi:hypothetical protein